MVSGPALESSSFNKQSLFDFNSSSSFSEGAVAWLFPSESLETQKQMRPYKEYKAFPQLYLEKTFISLPAWKKYRLVCLFWLKRIGWLILARRESLSTKSRNWKHGSPVAWSIHYTVSPKNWLCFLYWLWPRSNSPWKIDSVRLPSCRQYGKWIETQIKWSCPFLP